MIRFVIGVCEYTRVCGGAAGSAAAVPAATRRSADITSGSAASNLHCYVWDYLIGETSGGGAWCTGKTLT